MRFHVTAAAAFLAWPWQMALAQTVTSPGQLLCASNCGDTNADFVGGYTLDTTCDEGFYDMIYGGTCWKCPDDTDRRGEWIRTFDAVDTDTACYRSPTVGATRATKVKSPAWIWECPAGSFWDMYSPDGIGGSCWKCPDNYPVRTVWDHVNSDSACAQAEYWFGMQHSPAQLLSFNGCPAPDAAKMKLAGKRTPGNPFLDIAAGAGNGYAAGCFACPVVDEGGNLLITQRNGNPLYSRESNNGCTVLLKWKPASFREPGLAYLQGARDVIAEKRLFESDRLTGFLYDLALARGLGDATPAARDWVAAQWQEIAKRPYGSESLRAWMFAQMKLALGKSETNRTPGEKKLIQAFAGYIQARRVHLAEQALAMYDAWKAYDNQYRQDTGQGKSLGAMFYYGTVPFNFHQTIGSLMGLGATGTGTIGTLAAMNSFAQGVKIAWDAGKNLWDVTRETSLFGLTKGLNLLKSAQGLTALSGAALISAVGAILSSIAIDQLIAIETARPKLEAALERAKTPVYLEAIARQTNGEDMLYYYWAKAMDTPDVEDPQVAQLAAQAQARTAQGGYTPPPKLSVAMPTGIFDGGPTVSSGVGNASPFSSPGLWQGEKLVSNSGRFQAIMQVDGNFVIYDFGRPIWATHTNGRGLPPWRLAVQPDGNIVVYGGPDKDVALSGYGVCRACSSIQCNEHTVWETSCIALWASGLRGGTAPFRLEMQDDGNLVLYDSTHLPVWASGTQR
ncbi:MAG: hypothetical protein IT158_29460 [Bryobacterales bacterium]|nr:hypothetical protein [Bryobacterales bacterium]